MIDLQNCVIATGHQPVSTTTTPTQIAFDTAVCGGVGFAMHILSIGAIANNTSACLIEESDDNSTWTTVTGTFTLPTTVGSANSLHVAMVPIAGALRKRYLRCTVTTSTGAMVSAGIWIGSKTGVTPTTNALRLYPTAVSTGSTGVLNGQTVFCT